MERVTDIERIARGYADLCVTLYAHQGWDTLTTLRSYNRDGLGYQIPSESPGEGNYIQVSHVFLDDADLATVAARIDALIEDDDY